MAGEEGLNGELLSRFRAMQAAANEAGHSIGIGSGYRTVEQQIQLRISNGCPDIWQSPASSCRVPTAIPGSSNHNHGFAIDFSGDDAADAWVAANAAAFGLSLPIEGENWHLELADDETSRALMADAQANGAIGFDIEWAEKANPQDELANRLHSIMRVVGMGAPKTDLPADLIGLEGVEGEDPTKSVTDVESAIPDIQAANLPPGTIERSGGGDLQQYARQRLLERGMSEDDFNALVELWNRESNWNPNAQNPTSTAYGIAQFLNGTWEGVGGAKTSDPYKQIDYGIEYIAGRYGNPTKALQFHDQNNWY